MRIGIAFPQQAIGGDPIAVRDWAQAAEDLGFDHIIVYEHVLLPDVDAHPNDVFRSLARTSTTSRSDCVGLLQR